MILLGLLSLLIRLFTASGQLNAELLNWTPQISVFDHFLSSAECDLLIEAARNHTKYDSSSDASQSVYLQEYPNLRREFKDIEIRIAALTGEPPHPDEEPFNIHHNKKYISHSSEVLSPNDEYEQKKACLSSNNNNATFCGLMVHSVHHDKVQKEFSSVTVIVYLNSVEQGGGTVWPCLSKHSSGHSHPSRDCEAAFSAGARWFDGDKTVMKGIYHKHQVAAPLHSRLQSILLSAHVGCIPNLSDQPNWIEKPAIRTIAKKGTAVVFYHNRQDLTPEPLTWHAGCQPLSGDKWTLQKFKELNKRFRPAQQKAIQGINSEL